VSEAAHGDDDLVVAVETREAATGAVLGRVVAAGARATPLLDRRVLVGPIDPCGECDVCRRGGAAVCPLARRDRLEARGDRVIAAARWVLPLDDQLAVPALGGAAIAGSAAIAYTLYARSNVGPREPVIVTGGGAIARALVDVLVAKGIAPVIVSDDPAVIARATARGAPIVTAADGEVARVRDACVAALAARADGDQAGKSIARGVGRPWRVIAADAATASIAAALCGPRATLTLLAAEATSALPASLAAREVTVIGVAGAHPDLFVEVAAMAVKGELVLDA
jgi:D-arabinose 1-dehydrogenase-like Zn-dependent alcohol dehydrogenase